MLLLLAAAAAAAVVVVVVVVVIFFLVKLIIYVQILSTLNLSDTTSRFRTVSIFVIVDI
jgi:hypothetical protein